MSALKVVGVLIVAISGIVASYTLNAAARRSLEQTEGFIALIRRLRSDIECFAMPLPSALARCPAEVYVKCGYVAQDAPRSVLSFVEACAVSDAESCKAMRAFARSIGRGYREEQLAICDYYTDMLEERRQRLYEQLPNKTKRNSAMCLCGALAVVILLI
ncbi:MAG: hypothetical protein E7653_05220 [Ruminococcaceae bacterium]|nr:hypothetical protein [Oscillospiraceae bacterium]